MPIRRPHNLDLGPIPIGLPYQRADLSSISKGAELCLEVGVVELEVPGVKARTDLRAKKWAAVSKMPYSISRIIRGPLVD